MNQSYRSRERRSAEYSSGTQDSFRQVNESMYRDPYGKGQQYGEGRYGQGEYSSADYERGAYRGGYGGAFGESTYGRDYGPADEDANAVYGYVAAGYEQGMQRRRDYDDIYGAYPGRGNYGRRNPDSGALGYHDHGEYWNSPYQDAYSRYEDAGDRANRSARLGREGRRGPKGYTRSDDRIKEVVAERLYRSDDVDSSEVTLDVQDRKVILSGTVPHRWMRHAIEDIVDACVGVQDIVNHIRVEPRSETPERSTR